MPVDGLHPGLWTAAFVLLTFLALYIHFKGVYGYWKARGVFYLPPSFPFGNIGPAVTKMSSGEMMKTLYDAAEGHDFFGFWLLQRPAIMLRSPELIKQVLVKDFPSFHDRAVHMDEQLDALSGHLFALKGAKWKSLRAKLTPTFTSGKMRMMFGAVHDLSLEMVHVLQPVADRCAVVELGEVMARFTTDVIASCAFGIQTNSLRDPEAEFRRMGRKIFQPSLLSSLRVAVLFMLPKLAKALKLRIIPKDVSDFFLTVVKETIATRESCRIFRKDFLQLLIQLKNEGKVTEEGECGTEGPSPPSATVGITVEEAAAQAFVFFMAGFETSSTTMTFALYELACNPAVQQRLRREMDEAVELGGGLTYDAVHSMTYLDQVLSETLRKYPPITGLNRQCTRRIKVPGSDVTIEEGCLVLTSILGLHRDPALYPDPGTFDPERFSPEEKARRPHFTYLPFGEGPRVCIGMRFGLMQAKIGLTALLTNFEFSTCDETTIPMKFDPNSIVLTPDRGMRLRISTRWV